MIRVLPTARDTEKYLLTACLQIQKTQNPSYHVGKLPNPLNRATYHLRHCAGRQPPCSKHTSQGASGEKQSAQCSKHSTHRPSAETSASCASTNLQGLERDTDLSASATPHTGPPHTHNAQCSRGASGKHSPLRQLHLLHTQALRRHTTRSAPTRSTRSTNLGSALLDGHVALSSPGSARCTPQPR